MIEPRPAPAPAATGEADRVMPRLQVDSDLVLIPVTVTDQEGRLITDLDKQQFKLYDNNIEQVITHFAREDAPVSIGLVFDCSGSMGPKLQRSRAAVAEFVRTANPEDEFSLVTFNDRARLVAGFGSDAGVLDNALLFIESHGQTALLDAICLSLGEMKHAKHSRKAILIVSDGGDNASRYSAREVKEWLRESDVQVYSIGIFEPPGMRGRTPEELSGPALLDAIAQQTGGRLFEVYDLDDMRDAASKVGNALRNQYILGFSPTSERDGKYHHIQVKIPKTPGLPAFRTTFRSGYYAR